MKKRLRGLLALLLCLLLSGCSWPEVVPWARERADCKAGKRIAARIAMMAITTRSSIRVKCFFINIPRFFMALQAGLFVDPGLF